MNFLDHKEFQILSSVGSPSPLEPTGKPEMLSIFTTGMVGHEVVHKLSVEKTSRSQIRSFFKKLFLHILDTSLINAYTISKHTPDMKKNDFHHFLMSLIKGIFLKYTYPPPQPTASSDPDWIRLNGRHIKFDKYEKPRRCHVCSKAGLRRSVMRGCALCKVPLCLEECFELFHTVEDYAKAKQKKSGGRTRTI